MTFSIVIPCFNQVQYLADAVQSALDQSLKAEIIIVDDGSTDGSSELADTFGVKVIHQVNKGLASARNTGIMNATTQYVLFLDADDMLVSSCLETIFISAKDADIIMWDFKEFGVRNQEVRLQTPTLESLKSANRLAYCSAVNRTALLEVGGFNPKMALGYEDWDLWIDLAKRGKSFSHIPHMLFLYRTKEQSMLTESVKHHHELVNQIHKNHADVFA